MFHRKHFQVYFRNSFSLHFPGFIPDSAKKPFLTTVPSVTLRNGEEGRRRAGPEEGEEVGREEVMGDS